ncbi:MAG TPA: putative Ig domain-containing protein [Streptosporangiaceae bacterium]|jgi:DNA-binding beta-propeller fold protein YncE
MAAALLSVNLGQASAASGGYSASVVQTPAAGSALAVDSATDTIYLATNSGVIVVNGATNTVTTTINTPAPVNAIAVDPATDTIYLAASPFTPGPVIDVINGATNTVTTSISVPIGITSLAVDSTTNTVYAAEPGLAQVAVIDGATDEITTNVATGTGTRPYRLAVDQSTDTVWAADPSGRLIGIDGATDAVSTDIPLSGTEPISLAVNGGTNTIYVGDLRNSQVIVLDGKTGAVITDIAVGPALYGLDVDQSSGVVYASASFTSTGTTWVINGSTNEIEDSIGRGSTGVVVDQATSVVYEPAQRQAAIFTLTAGAANAMSPVITSAGSSGFIVGEAGLSFTVTSSALPAASISETGSLPSGVTMSASGVLSGTPAVGSGGLYKITITASNGIAPDFTQQFSLNVYEAPAITSGDSATFEVGTAGSFSLTATGYQAPSFTSAGSLPGGLSISDQTPGGWQISGTPAVGTGGVYPLTILAYNGVGSEAQQAFTLTVKEAPSFKSTPKATFVAGTSGRFQVSANGYPAPTYTAVGALPSGLALSSAGLLTGTPAANSGGVYPITITASNGIAPSANQAFTLTVDQHPAITSARSTTFKVGHWRRFIFRATGFPAAKLSERGRLPIGVRFKARDNGTAQLAGRAIRADRGKTYVITVIARNGVGPAVRETFRLKVA